MRFVATLFLALSLALPLNARALSEEEQAGLTKAVDSYRRVTTAKNAEKIVATIPPRVLNVFAGTATLQDGTKVVWAVVPTQFAAEGKAGKSRNSQPLLAILESGKWYFSRIDGPQQQQIVSFAYPFIAGVSLPAATSTPLQ